MNLCCEVVSFNSLKFIFWQCSRGRHQPWTDRLTDGSRTAGLFIVLGRGAIAFVAAVVFVILVCVTAATAVQCWRVIRYEYVYRPCDATHVYFDS